MIAGSTPSQLPSKNTTCHVTNLERQLNKFWSIEEIAIDVPKSEEEVACETHFLENVSRASDGRYIVRLPFRGTNRRLGESRSIALKHLTSLERKLSTNAMLKAEYDRVIGNT